MDRPQDDRGGSAGSGDRTLSSLRARILRPALLSVLPDFDGHNAIAADGNGGVGRFCRRRVAVYAHPADGEGSPSWRPNEPSHRSRARIPGLALLSAVQNFDGITPLLPAPVFAGCRNRQRLGSQSKNCKMVFPRGAPTGSLRVRATLPKTTVLARFTAGEAVCTVLQMTGATRRIGRTSPSIVHVPAFSDRRALPPL